MQEGVSGSLVRQHHGGSITGLGAMHPNISYMLQLTKFLLPGMVGRAGLGRLQGHRNDAAGTRNGEG